MIRKLLNGDIDRVADIWLKTNLKAHYFISNQYWKSNYELVKEMMSQSEVYVFSMPEKDKAVLEEICKAYNIKAEDLIRQFYLWVIREPEAAAQWLKGENNRKNAQRLFYSGGKEKISKK